MKFPEHYTLKEDADKHFTIHDNRDGSSFQVSKKGIHPANQIKIMRLEKYSEGGEVKKKEPSVSMPDPQKAKDAWAGAQHGQMNRLKNLLGIDPKKMADGGGVSEEDLRMLEQNVAPWSQAPQPLPGQVAPQTQFINPAEAIGQFANWAMQPAFGSSAQAEELPSQAQLPAQDHGIVSEEQFAGEAPAPAPAPAPAQPQMPKLSDYGMPTQRDVTGIEKQMEAGLMGEAKGLQEQERQKALAIEEHQKQVAYQNMLFNERMQDLQVKEDQLASDIASAKINPNQFWENKSTGSKVGAVLGIILGGLGAGLQRTTHNAAWEALQGQINKDIQNQKDELGKKNGLLAHNLRQQGNLAQAENVTRLQMNSALQGQLALVAAKTNSPIVMEKAKQQIALIKKQNLGIRAEIAQHQVNNKLREMEVLKNQQVQTQNQQVQQQLQRGVTPEQAATLPPEIRKTMATLPNGLMVNVGTEKKAQKVEDVNYRHSTIKSNLQALKQLVGKHGTFELTGPAEETMEALLTEVAIDSAKLVDPESIAREGEVKIFRGQLFQPGTMTMSNQTALKLLDNYETMVNNRSQEQYKSMGVTGFSQSKPTMPNDIQTMGGKKYRKVKGGWVPADQ